LGADADHGYRGLQMSNIVRAATGKMRAKSGAQEKVRQEKVSRKEEASGFDRR